MFPLPTGTPSHPEQQVLNPHQLYNVPKKSHKEDNLETHQYYEALTHTSEERRVSPPFSIINIIYLIHTKTGRPIYDPGFREIQATLSWLSLLPSE